MTAARFVDRILVAGILFVLCVGSNCSCGGGDSKKPPSLVGVTVKNTDCPMANIRLTSTVQQDNTSNGHFLRISVTVKCLDQPLQGAELIITIPGDIKSVNLETDSTGSASGSSDVYRQDLVGQTVSIAVMGIDAHGAEQTYPQGTVTITKAP